MATQRQRIKAHIANRLRGKARGKMRLPDIDAAWTDASQPLRAQMMAAINRGDAEGIGAAMQRIVETWLIGQAESEADNILADDQISLDELERINGPF